MNAMAGAPQRRDDRDDIIDALARLPRAAPDAPVITLATRLGPDSSVRVCCIALPSVECPAHRVALARQVPHGGGDLEQQEQIASPSPHVPLLSRRSHVRF